MSRSYKKSPVSCDNKGKQKKRMANHAVRSWLKAHPESVLHGAAYKNVFSRYDVCDYAFYQSFEEYWNWLCRCYTRSHMRGREIPDKKTVYKEWYKWYKMK